LIEATIVADSIGADAPRLTTYQLIYPRFIHAEVMTHRVFSRNASSSRAIPTARMLASIEKEPARPVDWRMNEPGMQGFEPASEGCVKMCNEIWDAACRAAVQFARHMDSTGIHKQVVNRLTEPFQHIRVVLTATDFDNFFALRDHPDAEPHIQLLARAMKEAMEASSPKLLSATDCHLPYVDDDTIVAAIEWFDDPENAESGIPDFKNLLCRISAARCARVSYKTFEGKPSTIEADLGLYEKLVGSAPIHASPTEHQASPDHWMARGKSWLEPQLHGNFTGWKQFRKTLPNENLQPPVASGITEAE
jgi:hypothetical protein